MGTMAVFPSCYGEVSIDVWVAAHHHWHRPCCCATAMCRRCCAEVRAVGLWHRAVPAFAGSKLLRVLC